MQADLKHVLCVVAAGFALQSQCLAADCVTIGAPKPAQVFTYEHVESTGARGIRTEQWEVVNSTIARVRTTRNSAVTLQANSYQVRDDVAVLEKTSRMNASGVVLDTTTFKPGLILDPVFRACAGKSWNIAASTASFQSPQNSASAPTPAGELRIIAIREKVTVPAGTFDTVHYTRTSQSQDEYWKSIEHGVVVKHISRLGGYTVTETLQSIR
jgi:hypothetical protein